MKSRSTPGLVLACLLALAACKSTETKDEAEKSSRVHLGMLELDFLSVFRDAHVVWEGPDEKTYRVEVQKLGVWGERGDGFVKTTNPHRADFVFRDGRLVEYCSVH